jgi:ATP-dependent DNA helicase RecQ
MSVTELKKVVAKNWGYDDLRPLQERAMTADLEGRDSLVVLPTGGGKSLCYQAPAALRGEGHTTVVVSPLIALMKDQVDGLRACGVPAVQIDSSQSSDDRGSAEMVLIQRAVRLLFVSPERLALQSFRRLLQQARVRTFAIDEAHCISHWGHDFRPEYRQLKLLKELFPESSVHAYTATATERVRRDIIDQLGLKDAEVLVGDFDRPNLTYRVLPRMDLARQVFEILDRHPKEAGILYCLRRKDVDDLTATLRARGHKAEAYHAGMSPEARTAAQESFAEERCDVVVATVAFGMGIDCSNIRFVLHTAMPKSLEHYQQETGRAGRDGLEAECVLLHSGADLFSWKRILEKSAAEPGVNPAFLPAALQHLEHIDRYCRDAVCRHRALVEYFGQTYTADQCAACDICLGDAETVPDSLVVAQKILSCVARVGERFGVGQVIAVLRGENTAGVRRRGHDRLSTFGLLRDRTKADVRQWIHQLIGQKALLLDGGEYPILRLNEDSWEVMKGQKCVRLLQPVRREEVKEPKAASASWDGVDSGLFEVLRGVRGKLAAQRGVPAYIVFGDATLRELARVRPSSPEKMRLVYGVGEAKLRDFGQPFLDAVAGYCCDEGLTLDNFPPAGRLPSRQETAAPRTSKNSMETWAHFRAGKTIIEVARATGRTERTVAGYLCDYIRTERPPSISRWVSETDYLPIAQAARRLGTDRLKPIFIALDEKFPYEQIQLVVAHLQAQSVS